MMMVTSPAPSRSLLRWHVAHTTTTLSSCSTWTAALYCVVPGLLGIVLDNQFVQAGRLDLERIAAIVNVSTMEVHQGITGLVCILKLNEGLVHGRSLTESHYLRTNQHTQPQRSVAHVVFPSTAAKHRSGLCAYYSARMKLTLQRLTTRPRC